MMYIDYRVVVSVHFSSLQAILSGQIIYNMYHCTFVTTLLTVYVTKHSIIDTSCNIIRKQTNKQTLQLYIL